MTSSQAETTCQNDPYEYIESLTDSEFARLIEAVENCHNRPVVNLNPIAPTPPAPAGLDAEREEAMCAVAKFAREAADLRAKLEATERERDKAKVALQVEKQETDRQCLLKFRAIKDNVRLANDLTALKQRAESAEHENVKLWVLLRRAVRVLKDNGRSNGTIKLVAEIDAALAE
jgi:hypothetical protein